MRITIAFLIALIVVGPSFAQCPVPEALQELSDVGVVKKKGSDEEAEGIVKGMRPNAIRETVYTCAFQRAVQHYYGEITELLERISPDLDKAFDFRGLMYPENVVPAVIQKADDSHKIHDGRTAIETMSSYRIHEKARVVTLAPNWRDYLWKEFSAIKDINEHLYPQNKDELRIWKNAVEEGWHDGKEHAVVTFQTGLNLMVRDYRGIIQAHILESNQMIEAPTIASGRRSAVIGEQGSTLEINQRIIKLTTETRFTPVESWSPAVHKAEP
ncbi:hypothetical protein DSCO28_73210 (plasmid) [Desulfosarcina ovata subsp. sediminis]|uniref:Type IV secretion system protein DotC n=1 Tax=Desulfosarcina ovata subsp. sediminis TaxID=885957 RepID=A0A5K8A2E1_9BACT|nr:type IV secretory system conjugative DNA transfer family protein [Desulfosarcina ovata]BBO86755.1 hypothetical protein DSCO28_73210 [Desulfosarcina ovata subsp. sediminis]